MNKARLNYTVPTSEEVTVRTSPLALSETSLVSAERSDPRIGTVLRGRWTLVDRLGCGAMATVYSAKHRNGDCVAIKILSEEAAANRHIRGRFLREGYVANRVCHRGTVRVLDDGVTEDGLAFIVMDLLRGELVEDRRVRLGGKVPLDLALHIGEEALDVLASAHEKGILHRDIKPENLFLCEGGELRVLDFGIARMREALAIDRTGAGTVLGTLDFMSPEQALGDRDRIDHRADVWSTGATLFTLLSGQTVYNELRIGDHLLALTSRPPRSLRDAAPELPNAVISAIDRALSFQKEKRWQDARAMRRALAAARHRVEETDDAGIVPARHDSQTVQRVPNSRPLSARGVDSYSLYLWQQHFLNRRAR
jgi:serine/threonine-protein kinase